LTTFRGGDEELFLSLAFNNFNNNNNNNNNNNREAGRGNKITVWKESLQ